MEWGAPSGGTDVAAPYLPIFRSLEGSSDSAVSPAGAVGRYQIMPSTAARYGYDPSKLSDPTYNENVARTIISDLHNRFNGNLQDMAVGYNASSRVVDRWLKSG